MQLSEDTFDDHMTTWEMVVKELIEIDLLYILTES